MGSADGGEDRRDEGEAEGNGGANPRAGAADSSPESGDRRSGVEGGEGETEGATFGRRFNEDDGEVEKCAQLVCGDRDTNLVQRIQTRGCSQEDRRATGAREASPKRHRLPRVSQGTAARATGRVQGGGTSDAVAVEPVSSTEGSGFRPHSPADERRTLSPADFKARGNAGNIFLQLATQHCRVVS